MEQNFEKGLPFALQIGYTNQMDAQIEISSISKYYVWFLPSSLPKLNLIEVGDRQIKKAAKGNSSTIKIGE